MGICCGAEVLDCGVCEMGCDVSKEGFCYGASELGCDDALEMGCGVAELGCGEAVASYLDLGALEMGLRAHSNLSGLREGLRARAWGLPCSPSLSHHSPSSSPYHSSLR